MRARRLVLAGICLALVIIAVALVFDQMAGRPGPASAPGNSGLSGVASGSTASGSTASGSGASGTTVPGSAGTASAGSGSKSSNSTAQGKPLEVLPPVAASPTGLPAPTTPAPLITGALPPAAKATGAMVAGWPEGVLTLPTGTAIGSTSVSASGNVLQLAADGVLSASQANVLGAFRQSLAAHGFWSEDAPATNGTVAARFVRGTDTVTVSVSTTGTGDSRFELLGSLHAAAG